jgi:hypothetical protein
VGEFLDNGIKEIADDVVRPKWSRPFEEVYEILVSDNNSNHVKKSVVDMLLECGFIHVKENLMGNTQYLLTWKGSNARIAWQREQGKKELAKVLASPDTCDHGIPKDTECSACEMLAGSKMAPLPVQWDKLHEDFWLDHKNLHIGPKYEALIQGMLGKKWVEYTLFDSGPELWLTEHGKQYRAYYHKLVKASEKKPEWNGQYEDCWQAARQCKAGFAGVYSEMESYGWAKWSDSHQGMSLTDEGVEARTLFCIETFGEWTDDDPRKAAKDTPDDIKSYKKDEIPADLLAGIEADVAAKGKTHLTKPYKVTDEQFIVTQREDDHFSWGIAGPWKKLEDKGVAVVGARPIEDGVACFTGEENARKVCVKLNRALHAEAADDEQN